MRAKTSIHGSAGPRTSACASGAGRSAGKIKFSHLQFETTVYDWQGAQITLICFDELTHFTAHQFFYMVSRNRSTCGVRPYIRATCNPDADSWLPTSWRGGLTRRAGFRSPSVPAFCAISSASRKRSFGPIGPMT